MTPQKVFLGYTTGKTCYFLAFRPDTGQVLDAQSKTWVTFTLADLANYVMTLTEYDSSGFYSGEYPSDFTLDVLPTEVSYQQAGPAPAFPADTLIGVGQSQGSNVAAVNNSVNAADNMGASTASEEQGTVQSGSNTTGQIVTDLSGATDDLYRGRAVIFTIGAMSKCAAIITGYNATTKVLTFTTIPTAPTPGDTFVVV